MFLQDEKAATRNRMKRNSGDIWIVMTLCIVSSLAILTLLSTTALAQSDVLQHLP